jgi:hypothetical protein
MLTYPETDARDWPYAWEFAALRVCRPNVLIEAPLLARERLLHQLQPHIPSVVAKVSGRGLLTLPPPTKGIIVHDVDNLSTLDQARLYAWMSEGDVLHQVVSTSAQSVYALVKSGLFCEDLYYRLNVVLLVVTCGALPGGE